MCGGNPLQVTRPGAIDPSAVDTTEDQAIIGKARKKVWVLTVVGYLALFILWPCLMAPAGGTWSVSYFRSDPLLFTALPPTPARIIACKTVQRGSCVRGGNQVLPESSLPRIHARQPVHNSV